MPTGYTACIEDGATFEQFVWGCARGMGACIMMRDDAWDKPIPEAFEPSTFYKERVAEAEAKISDINSLSDEAINEQQVADNAKVRGDNERRRIEHEETKLRYNAIKSQVEAWQPPSADHVGMKKFMLEQIETGQPYDSIYQEEENDIIRPEEWRKERLANAMTELARAKDDWNKEQERTACRNRWIKQLRDSIPQPAPFKKAA
jgi:hypothetical protein